MHNRKTTRLTCYDYRKEGLYFITICAYDRECLFGEIENGKMILNDIGKIAENCWKEIPEHFQFVEIDEYIIMPNHIHGILAIENKNKFDEHIDDKNGRGVACNAPTIIMGTINEYYSRISPKKGSLSSVIRSYKSAVTKQTGDNKILFSWQRNFHDHIIRDDKSFERIRNYIIENPQKWKEDKFYK